MKCFLFVISFFIINITVSAQQAWTVNDERGVSVKIEKMFFEGAEGTFKIESPQSGWEYDGPMDLPILTIDRHYSYKASKCTPSVHAIGCPGSLIAIVDKKTKITVMNRNISRKELDLLNGKKVIVVGKIQVRKDSEYNTHDYWVELTILVAEKN